MLLAKITVKIPVLFFHALGNTSLLNLRGACAQVRTQTPLQSDVLHSQGGYVGEWKWFLGSVQKYMVRSILLG